jgi:hypothetical protein
MRFPAAWADIASQNVTLKGVIVALSIALITVSTVAARLGLKDAVIIERGCYSQLAKATPAKVTDDEIKGFLSEVLPQRFGTQVEPSVALLSPTQLKARITELDDLSRKGMRQVLIVNEVRVDGETIRVDADRLIAIDKIRSAFPMALDVSVSKTTRSNDNPYGLVLTKVSTIEAKEGE